MKKPGAPMATFHMLLAGGALLLGLAGAAQAQQDFPNRAIKIVVPWPAGGAHGYYETDVVSEFGPELANEVYKKAQSLKALPFLKAKTTLEKMRELSTISAKDMEKILKLDPMIKKSTLVKEKGMELRTTAERKSAAVGYKIFHAMIIEQMARSSALLAQLWEEAYIASGKPDLSKYRSYKYPFTPDFVRPDYIGSDAPKK